MSERKIDHSNNWRVCVSWPGGGGAVSPPESPPLLKPLANCPDYFSTEYVVKTITETSESRMRLENVLEQLLESF